MEIYLNRNICLYGDLRCCKDFQYVFPDKSHARIVYGEARQNQVFHDKRTEYFYIVCSFDKDAAGAELKSIGLEKGIHYEYADYYFEKIAEDYINRNKRKVFIWGAGVNGQKCLEIIKDVDAFIDTNTDLHGKTVCGKQIVSPEQLTEEEWKNSFIIVSPENYFYEIRNGLLNKGLVQNIDFVQAKKLFAIEQLKETFYDKTYYEFACESFFRVFEVEANGNISNCCTTLTKLRSGNLLYEEYDEIWNSLMHRIQCLSLINHTFTFCIPHACPALINREKKEVTDELAAMLEYKEIPDCPEYLHLSIDETCNLYCESCRDCIRVSGGEELEKTLIMKEKIMNSPLCNVKELYIAGNGEVFLSKIYEEIWKSDLANKADTIRVLTNGMLFIPKKWEEFYIGKENTNIWLYVSIDAATKNTYESIRRGGNFDILQKNMEFASQLRKEGKIQYFRINFVVQKKNYLEMERFIEWGMELGVDNVFFTKILNWGTYSAEEFVDISMMEPDNQHPKPEFKEILDKEIFKNPIVDLGTIQYERNRVLPDYVDNYYVWETRDWMKRRNG